MSGRRSLTTHEPLRLPSPAGAAGISNCIAVLSSRTADRAASPTSSRRGGCPSRTGNTHPGPRTAGWVPTREMLRGGVGSARASGDIMSTSISRSRHLSRVRGHPSGRLPVIIRMGAIPQQSSLNFLFDSRRNFAGFGRLFCQFSGSGFGREASRWRPSRTAGEAFSGIPPRQEQRPCGSLTISAGATTRPRLNFRDHRLGRNE